MFTTVYHHITDVDNLRACYDSLPADKASGVDGVTKAEYGEDLEEHLRDLSARLKRMGYRPAPKRRTYVPEGGQREGPAAGHQQFQSPGHGLIIIRALDPPGRGAD